MLKGKFNPILSICIPTYNRSILLDKLLNQIFKLSELTKSKIEICISDNFCSDATSSVIENWEKKLKLISIRQEFNIGASRNFQEVARLSTAPWVLLMGDDDLLSVSGFENLLTVLETVNPDTWIFADICNQDGTTLLEKFPPGHWSKHQFKKRILFNSLLDSLGFMSMHVIPKDSIRKFTLLSLDRVYGWPHLALLFYDLSNINFHVQRECIVRRGGDGEEVTQTWRSNDWLCLMMQKTKLCCFSATGKNMFSTGIALREYLRWPYARQTFHAMSILGKRGELLPQSMDYIDSTNIHKVAKLLIRLYVFLLLLIPVKLILVLRKLKNPSDEDISRNEEVNILTDGIDRGL